MAKDQLFPTLDLFEAKDLNTVLSHLHSLKGLVEKNGGSLASLALVGELPSLKGSLSPRPPSSPASPASTSALETSGTNLTIPEAKPKRRTSSDAPVVKPLNLPVQQATRVRRASFGDKASSTPSIPEEPHPSSNKSVSSLEDDVRAKELLKYNVHLEQNAWDWLEELLGRSIGDRKEPFVNHIRSGTAALLFLRRELIRIDSGEVLCEVMNLIVPGAITKVNRAKVAFAHMENIAAFLKAFPRLGLKAPFTTVDLYESKNLAEVRFSCHCPFDGGA